MRVHGGARARPCHVVHQRVAGAGVARTYPPVRPDPGDVRHPADIGDDDVALESGTPHKCLMIKGNERRPLPARGHVGGAEIEHHRDAGAFGQFPAVADLDREPPLRRMEHGLSMESNQLHGLPVLPAKPLDGLGMGLGDHRFGRP